MTEYALIIDYKYCTGCNTCVVACQKEKGLPVNEWGIKVNQMGPEPLEGKWQFDYVPVVSNICDVCVGRIEEGKKPACVHHCLAQCMEAAPIEDVSHRIKDMGHKVVVYIP